MNNYEKKDIRLLNTNGLVIGVQPEGLQPGVFTVLDNTKIYRQGAIGLRDQRDLFAGLDTQPYTDDDGTERNVGRDLWIQYITRFDKDYLLGFGGRSLYAWNWSIPDPSFSGAATSPAVGQVLSFPNFLPYAQIPSAVSILPAERSAPVTYFVWPGAERMYKVLLQETGEGARLAVHFWGINSPSARPQVRIEGNLGAPATGQPAKGLTASTADGFSGYDWIYTYTNLATGHESNPSAGLALTLTTVSQYDYAKLSIPVDTGGDPQIDGIRVYRSGGLNVNYTRVGEIKLAEAHLINGVGTVDFIDKKSDSEIFLAPQVRLDNYVPFVSTNQNGDAVWNANVSFIFGPFADRVILGIGEKNQPGNVFWTNPSRPDSSGPNNNAQVTSARDPLVSGLVYNGLPYVASRGDWYALDFSVDAEGNAAFTPRRTQAGKGPIGPWAAASGDAIYFVTQDGVMKTDGQSPAQSISEDINIIFHNQSTPEYAAIDFSSAQELFRLYWAAPELHFLYPDTSGEMQHLIFDGAKWRSETFASDGYSANYPNAPWTYDPVMHPTCVYWDVAYPQRSVLLGTDRKAVFIQRPYQSAGLETAYFDYDSDNGDDWVSTSRAGWVVGRFRTHSDDFERPAHLKELGDVSFEASVQGAEITGARINAYGTVQGALDAPSTPFYAETALTLYANAESGTLSIDSSIEPSTALTGVPIGSDIYNTAVTGRQRFPLGIDNAYQYVYSTAWDFSFIGPWNFHNLTVFWRTDSEVITHWHQCNQDFGHNGWLHARDGFVDARLYGDATLTLEVDLEDSLGTSWPKTDTITLSPIETRQDGTVVDYTGKRRKYYFSFLPFKGRKWTFTIDCAAGMRLYSDGSELYSKQWTTGSGYTRSNPWAKGAEA